MCAERMQYRRDNRSDRRELLLVQQRGFQERRPIQPSAFPTHSHRLLDPTAGQLHACCGRLEKDAIPSPDLPCRRAETAPKSMGEG